MDLNKKVMDKNSKKHLGHPPLWINKLDYLDMTSNALAPGLIFFLPSGPSSSCSKTQNSYLY